MKKQTIIEIISALFILLFVYTAINKFLAFEDLKEVLKKYPLIGGISVLLGIAGIWLYKKRLLKKQEPESTSVVFT